ncbi:2',3'-cyclic-nucleotide 3'-phosphodiesterase [Plenodomus tracheiphilus IPT5]|uniref:2',3'-cyclic-nucleotide 3'-phosphodiesterase n=1 Tax=Plenodomus tracheiphilus IPT5 TaxID=1408161 RepID=A0A6A7BQ45_9PLEO|nr:2',3'-cyclic-nucleotide 3'-phosphodiesterase [Plenodomus tracheiphilus IPT5]
MPGSSLWLLPPPTHPLTTTLPTLISKTSTHFSSPHRFIPHITLTSSIPPSSYINNPQAFLDALVLPSANDVVVTFEALASEDVFVRKLYIKCGKSGGLAELAGVCRGVVPGFEEQEKVEKWVEEEYRPHLSLLYHDCPAVGQAGLAEVEGMARDLGVDVRGRGEMGGWKGGRVVLVPTDEAIEEWNVIAERSL